jgi:hypothetical protein
MNWDTKNITNFSDMFKETTSFNQPISNWCIIHKNDKRKIKIKKIFPEIK